MANVEHPRGQEKQVNDDEKRAHLKALDATAAATQKKAREWVEKLTQLREKQEAIMEMPYGYFVLSAWLAGSSAASIQRFLDETSK